jgi:hypothetical protein
MPRAICGRRPPGIVSVARRRNPVIAMTSRAASGNGSPVVAVAVGRGMVVVGTVDCSYW